MALIQYYDVPQNTFNTINLPRASYGLRIENNSNQFIAVKDDLGHIIAQCPPGISASWNALEGMHSPQIGCLGYYQGNARVYFYDSQVDTNGNPALQQPPGTVATTDPLVEQLLTALNTLIGTTNVNTGGASTNTGTLVTLINSLNNLVGTTNTNTGNTSTNAGNTATSAATLVTLLNALNNLVTTTNALDTDIRTYINYVRGLLALASANFTLSAGQEFTYALPTALSSFTLQTAPISSGRLNIYVIGSGGAKDFILKDQPLYIGPSVSNPSPKIYRRNLLTGDVIHIGWDDSVSACGFALRV